jgi:2-iminoacetate synthase ThiH
VATVTDEDLHDIARRAGQEGAQEALRIMGIDPDNPLEAQKDMHFLRDLRTGTRTVKGKAINAVVAALALAGLYKLFDGLKWGP